MDGRAGQQAGSNTSSAHARFKRYELSRESRSTVGAGAVLKPSLLQVKQPLRQLMQCMLTCTDDATGRLVSALKAKSMWADTLMVWSADKCAQPYDAFKDVGTTFRELG